MKTTLYTLSICFFALLIIQCDSKERATKALTNDGDTSKTTEIANSIENETYYILSASGLRMRADASLDGEKLDVVEYGAEIKVDLSDASSEIEVSGIKGKMAKTFYKKDEGYMFTGYMSSIPVPEKDQKMSDYASQLKRKGFNAKFDSEEIDDGMELDEVLSIPAKSLTEAFLIGQRLNIFEIDFDLPANSEPTSLKARANGKALDLKLINPTTVGAVQEPAEGAPNSDVYIEGYQFNVPVKKGDNYWMKLIDIKFDEKNQLSEIMTQVAYEGGSCSCTLQEEDGFYVFRKNSIAD